jgi:translocator protein
MKIRWLSLLACVVFCLLAGGIGSIFTAPAIGGWYATIAKPTWNPPNWLFGPVWTLLYVLMGISLYLAWYAPHARGRRRALFLFFIQLGLNTLWSIIFFGLASPLFAFIEIIALWFFILLTLIAFYRISKPAAYLMMPYLLWVSFAAVLNYAIVLLNG